MVLLPIRGFAARNGGELHGLPHMRGQLLWLSTRGSEDCAAWRDFDGGNAPAVEHHEPVTMAGANHASVIRKRVDDSLDGLALVEGVVLVPNVELVAAHETDPQHYFCHAQSP